MEEDKEFQFPSNGKAYPKTMSGKIKAQSSFNSLQTGKRIQSWAERWLWLSDISEFQFPSNGKAYPKSEDSIRTGVVGYSFNSLQTGKRIQRTTATSSLHPQPVSIPFKRESVSKGLTTKPPEGRSLLQFQFPSNGKAYPKTPPPNNSD